MAGELGMQTMPGDRPVHSPFIYVPIIGSDRVLGMICCRGPRARERLSASPNVRLLHHGRREHGRGAGERAPLRRDAAAAEGNRAARRRARDHQQRPGGLAVRARLPGDRRLVGDKLREVFDRRRTSASAGTTPRLNLVHFLYLYEHGERARSSHRAARRQASACSYDAKTRQPVVVNTRHANDGWPRSGRRRPRHATGASRSSPSRSSAATACSG